MTLGQLAAKLEQHCTLLDFLNTLGHQSALEGAGQANHALQNRQVIRRVEHVTHKTLVNFEQCHWQPFQVSE